MADVGSARAQRDIIIALVLIAITTACLLPSSLLPSLPRSAESKLIGGKKIIIGKSCRVSAGV
jgi:hypothetical protein